MGKIELKLKDLNNLVFACMSARSYYDINADNLFNENLKELYKKEFKTYTNYINKLTDLTKKYLESGRIHIYVTVESEK